MKSATFLEVAVSVLSAGILGLVPLAVKGTIHYADVAVCLFSPPSFQSIALSIHTALV